MDYNYYWGYPNNRLYFRLKPAKPVYMNFFDKIFNQLFSNSGPSHKVSQPMVAEALKRKDIERSNYFEWQNSGAYKTTWNTFYQAYQKRLGNEISNWEIHLLQMPAANGLALSYPSTMSVQEFQHLFDLLKDKVLTLNYRLVNADRLLYDKKAYVETKEKYYLKPIIDFQNTKVLYNQLYGNILIELILIDQKPSYIKLVASIYSDRLYTEALAFESLVKILFEVGD